MAGNNPLELYQDGSSTKTVQDRFKDDNHSNTHTGKDFDVIRYTNSANIKQAKTRFSNIQAELDKRPPKPTPFAIKPAAQDATAVDLALNNTIDTTPEVELAKPVAKQMGTPNLLKKMYNSVKGLGDQINSGSN